MVADVVDPAAGIELADRSTRLGASLLDGLIIGLLVYAPLVVGTMFDVGLQTGSEDASLSFGFTMGMVAALVGFIVWLWFTIKLLKANGQSIGKKACAIKVVRRDGSPASLSRLIWLRNVVNILLGVIPLYGLIDALFIFGNARRCVHDHLADTIVVKA